MDDLIHPDYGSGHRSFLQALMARGSLTFNEARPILAAIWDAQDGPESDHGVDEVNEQLFHDYVDTVRQAVSLFDYDIRTAIHQKTKQRVYALVNTQSDPQTQLATTYGAEELAFVKRALDYMFDRKNTIRMEVMAMTQMEAMKLARPDRRQSQAGVGESTQAPVDKGLKHSEVEDILASLVDGDWLEKSRAKFYSLTPRALLELRPWLMETYNDPGASPEEWQRIKLCAACKDLITYGLRCGDPACNFRLHDACEDAFWRVRGDKKCPKCSRDWTGQHYVGERAVTHTESYQRGRRRAVDAERSSLRDNSRSGAVHDEDDEDEDTESNE